MKLKRAYDNHEDASNETGLECNDPTLTQQHDEHDANINNIVATYMKTGEVQIHSKPPMESDFEMVTSMQDAMQLIVEARQAFMEQPAEIRARFSNDPRMFVDFCSKEANRDEMRKMGLLSEEEEARHRAMLEGKARLQAALTRDAEAFRRAQEAPKS